MKLKPLQFTCVFLSSLVSLNAVEGKPSQPNIVFILADDMGYSDMGWQGSPIQTPNLDKLRAGGMFLSRNYAQPQCSPSRAAFLSGFYPYRYGLQEHIVLPWSLTGLPREVKTIAQKLKEGGYETAVVGKWHVGGHLQSYLPHIEVSTTRSVASTAIWITGTTAITISVTLSKTVKNFTRLRNRPAKTPGICTRPIFGSNTPSN